MGHHGYKVEHTGCQAIWLLVDLSDKGLTTISTITCGYVWGQMPLQGYMSFSNEEQAQDRHRNREHCHLAVLSQGLAKKP